MYEIMMLNLFLILKPKNYLSMLSWSSSILSLFRPTQMVPMCCISPSQPLREFVSGVILLQSCDSTLSLMYLRILSPSVPLSLKQQIWDDSHLMPLLPSLLFVPLHLKQLEWLLIRFHCWPLYIFLFSSNLIFQYH